MDINYVKKYEPIDGKWFLTREIGSGSYGTVFEICRKDFNVERSALKVISVPEKQNEYISKKKEYRMDDESISAYFYGCVEEYTKEFALMSKLRGNSNIVSIEDYDVKPKMDEFGWDIFIRMELLSTLDDYFEAVDAELYPWRDECEEGYEYDVDPEDYETLEEYEAALNKAKYPWRDDCEEAEEYDIDPEDYETYEEYEEALNEAKYSWRNSYDADDYDVDPDDFETEEEFLEEIGEW